MNDRFKFRAPYFKNNEFDGFVYFEAGYDCKKPSDHGYLGRREQCTGLKDKNGKLIYEGDILCCMLNCPRKGVVEFYRNAFCLNENGSYSEDIVFSDKCCEVIGNVHENEELLK